MEERLHTRWVRTRPDESHWKTELDVQARSFHPSRRDVPHERDRHLAVARWRSKDYTFGRTRLPQIFLARSGVLNGIVHARELTRTRRSTSPAHSSYRNSSQVVQPVVRR